MFLNLFTHNLKLPINMKYRLTLYKHSQSITILVTCKLYILYLNSIGKLTGVKNEHIRFILVIRKYDNYHIAKIYNKISVLSCGLTSSHNVRSYVHYKWNYFKEVTSIGLFVKTSSKLIQWSFWWSWLEGMRITLFVSLHSFTVMIWISN